MKLFKIEEDMNYINLNCDGCGFAIPVHEVKQMNKITSKKGSPRLKGDSKSVDRFLFSLRSYYQFTEHLSQCRSYAFLRSDKNQDQKQLLEHVKWFDEITEQYPEAYLFYIQTRRAETIY